MSSVTVRIFDLVLFREGYYTADEGRISAPPSGGRGRKPC